MVLQETLSSMDTVTETIQGKECQTKWQDIYWVFIYKTVQMASVVPPVLCWSHSLESLL